MPDPAQPIAWITGAAGLIGSHLLQAALTAAVPWSVRPITRSTLDLTDLDPVARLFTAEQPRLVIHCAALSRSQLCQSQPTLARRLNVDVTAHLAALAANIPFILFSTDLVFDGRKGLYSESDPPNPLSVYGETKALAEQLVLRNPLHTVIRTSLNGGASPTGNRSFTEDMRHAWSEGQTLRLFTDEFRSPIPASVTALATWKLARLGATGILHVAGSERLSRYQIGQLVAARHPELRPRLEPASLRNYHGAPRPPDCSLDCAKVQALLPFPLPSLPHWLSSNPTSPF